MLGSAVSSSTPTDFHPSSHMGFSGSRPLMKFHARVPGPTQGCPYIAVGMHRAVESAIGLPSSSTSALWMLVFLMPAEVRRYFMMPVLLTLLSSGAQGVMPRQRLSQRMTVAAARLKFYRCLVSRSRRVHTPRITPMSHLCTARSAAC